MRNVCCIGAGQVGGPTGAVMANKAPHIKVTVVDVDPERINAWNSNGVPINEPDMFDLITIARDGTFGREPNLFFSTAIDDAIRQAELIFISVNTPIKTSGIGAGKASDLSWLELAVRRIAQHAEHDTIVVQRSTVPCGTAKDVQVILQANAKPSVNFEVLSNPEFMAEGTAVSNLLNPDRVLIGCFDTNTGKAAAEKLAGIYATWVPRDRIIFMDIQSAELSKLASNALLAQRISSINALSAICEEVGADIGKVSYACGLDSRIGPEMLNASLGFGGSCFKKDILNLSQISTGLNLPEVAAYWGSVIEMNEYQKNRFIHRIVDTMHCSLSTKKVAVLGFAYKKDTSDTRESPAISVVMSLLAENAIVAIFDPQVRCEQIFKDLKVTGSSESLQVCLSPYEACEDAHAVVILTEWDMFSNKLPVVRQPKATKSDISSPRGPIGCLKTLAAPSYHPEDRIDLNNCVGHCDGTLAKQNRLLDHPIKTKKSPSLTDEPAATETKPTPLFAQQDQERLDWSHIATLMQRPMHVFDGRNIIDAHELMLLDFHVVSIGSSLATWSSRIVASS